jgi:hypothetical protein
VYISVTRLCDMGKRLSHYGIKAQTPMIGWLHYDLQTYGPYSHEKVTARLLSDAGVDLLPPLDFARLIACRGRTGALIEGTEYRRRGTKHSISDEGAWWCEAPPRMRPLIDRVARILAAEREDAARKIAGWGSV